MQTIKDIAFLLSLLVIAALSWVLKKRYRKVEDLYDDMLDLRAENKQLKLEQKVVLKRNEYINAVKKYNKFLSKETTSIVFIPDNSAPVAASAADTAVDDGGRSSVPKRTKPVH